MGHHSMRAFSLLVGLLTAEYRKGLLGGVAVLSGKGRAVKGDTEGKFTDEPIRITAVPYYAWNHRGPGAMAVWLARTPEKATSWPRPMPQTIAGWSKVSTSHHSNIEFDTPDAANDGIEPKNSHDLELPRLT